MSDIFLTLAQTEKGLSCFIATGWLPDGSRNRLKIQRLKDKCGNKSNASSEIEFYDLYATMLGEEGRGIRTIIEMAHVTRLDFAVGSSGLMRQALSQAIHHTSSRRAFQRSLVDLPIMRNVLADLAVESEAFLWLSMRLAAALDREHTDRAEGLLSRIGTPVAKYWACKRVPQFVVEARRVPRRQRIHRRPPHGAPLSRGAAQRHLGGDGQRHLPRRAALDATRTRDGRRLSH
jgi:putative acyl-CoA dehydrogenase